MTRLRSIEVLTEPFYTMPREYYMSEDIYQEELEKLFYKQWFCVGRDEQIPNPGDYFMTRVGEENLIIVRDQDGAPRAHFDVCRHRGTSLCTQAQGRFLKRAIQCPYHGWTYSLDGHLVATPGMQSLKGFDKHKYSLHSAATVSWEGNIMINLDPNPQPFEDAFGSLINKFTPWQMPALQTVREIEYDVAANWKLFYQNFPECYHCPMIHDQIGNLPDYYSGQHDLTEGPFIGGYMEMDPDNGRFLSLSGDLCAPPIATIPPVDLHRTHWYNIMPNTFMLLNAEHVALWILWPMSRERTKVVCKWMFHPDGFTHSSFKPNDAVDGLDLLNRQDWDINEQAQRGIRSRRYTPGPYTKQEGLTVSFDKYYFEAMGHQIPKPPA